MSRPEVDEVLFAYIVVAHHAISLVLIRVDGCVKRPVYYVSKSLHEVEVHYLPLEKAILAVVHATHKLPHYFQSHTIFVLTQLSLRSILRSANYTERIAKWGTILEAFNIKYMPYISVKGQVLANLVAEFTEPSLEENAKMLGMDEKSVDTISLKEPLRWKVYVDGAANQRGLGVGLVLISSKRIIIEKSLRLNFLATNNEAEYEALLVGMTMVQRMGGKMVEMFLDSRLWGLDVVGPFPKAAGNRRWLLVGTDYFTKWVEVEPLSNIRDLDAKKFFWRNIVTRFGVPRTFISDNGLQFDS
ncbi:uncharacterized protein LOC142616246 [Castanea sativa]|uniref:uncharacterized protein LOC142616246 n=1 Tax=Castanea sativa TaxID=21020 RepID=UPI003F64ECC4